MPSQSVEAATREEAIAAAREEYGPSVKIVGVRRIRSGGVMGFFTNERFVAEVDLTVPRPEEPARGSEEDAGRRGPRARPVPEDDRMAELADLLRPASGEMPLGTYSSSGVARAAANEDVPAQRRPRATAAQPTAARTAADAAGRAAASPWGEVPGRSAAPFRTAARSRTVAEARAAAKGDPWAGTSLRPAAPSLAEEPAAGPFTPKRHRPTLDGFADPAPEPAAPAAPAGPSPFTAALARMAADRNVSAAVEDAVERSAVPAPAEPAVLRQPVFEDEVAVAVAVEETVEPFVEETPATASEAPAAAEPVPASEVEEEVLVAEQAPAPGDEAAPVDQRAVLQSALQSVLTATDDPEVERLLEGVLQRVLGGDGAAAAGDDALTSTGRHHYPEWAQPETSQVEDEPAAVVGDLDSRDDGDVDEQEFDGEEFDEEEFDEDLYDDALFDDDRPATGLFGTGPLTDPVKVRFEQVPPAAQVTPTDGWVADARREEVLVHDIRTPDVQAEDFRTQEFRLDLREHEVLAHLEPLVMTPSMAAWPSMARTASDPAPLSMDATTILPPLSLLPPQHMSSIGGTPPLLKGRPAVPPSRRSLERGPSTGSRPAAVRPAVPASPGQSLDAPGLPVTSTHRDLRLPLGLPAAPREGERRLATVTRLTRTPSVQVSPFGLSRDDELVVRLLALGLPEFLIAPDFAADAAVRGTYAALTRTLGERLPALPEVPDAPGDVLLVVGPGPETLAAGRSLAGSLRLDPARVQWATPSDAAYLAPEDSRITTLETAAERAEQSSRAGSVTIVAVDAPLRTGGGSWLTQMLSIWTPVGVWGVVDATRKLEDVVPWLDGLPRLDAVIVQDTDCTADPAAVLSHVTAPVARVDGARATAHRWASLLCERLEEMH